MVKIGQVIRLGMKRDRIGGILPGFQLALVSISARVGHGGARL